MNSVNTKKIALSSMFSALICLSCVLIHIPVPGGQGYLNISDALILASAFYLSPVYSVISAIIGSCLADLFLGCAIYVPSTIVAKGVIALAASLYFKKKGRHTGIIFFLLSVAAEAVSAAVYFLCEYKLIGYGKGAVINLPYNLIQGLISAFFAVLILKALKKKEVSQ